jgi:hypothetical protein
MRSKKAFTGMLTLLVPCLDLVAATSGAVSVTTASNDIQRSGVNKAETVLNVSNVRPGSFGKLFSFQVDGQIYAQPLYLPAVSIPGKGLHNVVYVATENDSVYAFDADSPSQTPLWTVSLGVPLQLNASTVLQEDCTDLCPQVGITSTPVIDVSRQAIYVVAETRTNSPSQPVAFYLHALDVTTGHERTGSPALISGQVNGTGDASVNGVVTFNALQQIQRPALLEVNGSIYIAFASHQDDDPWHGWIFQYDGLSLRRLGVFCTSPNGSEAGIWQGGGGLASDGNGFIYAVTGNGDFNPPANDYGDSVLKIKASGLTLASYFSPWNTVCLGEADWDLGSGGPVIFQGSGAQNTFIVAGGKDGRLILMNTTNLGGNNSSALTDNCLGGVGNPSNVDVTGVFDSGITALQEWNASVGPPNSLYADKVYFNNYLYVWPAGDVLHQYFFNGLFSTQPAHTGSAVIPINGIAVAALAISSNSNATGTGILWAVHPQVYTGDSNVGLARLHAYDASNVETELWNSDLSSSDAAAEWAKWVPPTIANGKVYLASGSGIVSVYGLLAQ